MANDLRKAYNVSERLPEATNTCLRPPVLSERQSEASERLSEASERLPEASEMLSETSEGLQRRGDGDKRQEMEDTENLSCVVP